MTVEHLPVLVREVTETLSIREGGIYIDATVGLGGHTEEILKKVGPDGKIIGIDRDEEALKRTAEKVKDGRLVLKKGSFSELEDLMRSEGISSADGVLFDLGVSMMQLRDYSRGFSFNSEERLDMRMDSASDFSAWDVVNEYPEKDLARVIKAYGEEYRAARIARAIVSRRKKKPIDTCSELAGIIAAAVGRGGRLHPATKTFQAIRIAVNGEIEELEKGLAASMRVLGSGGRFCVISYHSLEDRVVKNFIRENARSGLLRPLLKKPIVPDAAEIRKNPSARSAKLRGGEKI